ncbi:MAG: protein kinase [Gemmatimonadales bacterium]
MALTGVIDDRYSIERELGRGGMATVYLARDVRHGNRVALKVLSSDVASMVSGERFTREIRITAGLQHPHILAVFDSGSINGHPYYVMPFVDGPTLAERIRNEGPLPIEEALEIACEVADALRHAHAEGFVHRDIKPSNILLAHGHAVVADFGVATAVETVNDQDLTRTGIAVGTAAYMSPEQAAGEDVDGRSDIYSLGCVLYEMLAGRPPYTAANPRALMAKHWMDEVPSLKALRGSVRGSIDALVRKAMAKRPSERFATAGELEDAIQHVSTEEKFAASGLTPSEDHRAFAPAIPLEALADGHASAATATAIGVDSTGELGALAGEDPALTRIASGPSSLAPFATRQKGFSFRAAAVGALTVAAVAFAAWYFMRPAEAALDRNRVIVYPLLVPQDFKGPRNVGEDIGTMIGTALDGAGKLRWIDGWPLLSPAARQDIRSLPTNEARNIARSRRAAWYLMGRIVARGDSSEVFLELNDVAGDSTVARGRAVGLTSNAWRTGLHAVNALLPVLIPSGANSVDILSEWNDRDPKAVASFLLGESAFRRARLAEALDHYRDAMRGDSTFTLAAIRGAQAATWNHRPDEAESFIRSALSRPMPPRYMHFARGYEAYIAGSAERAAAELYRAIEIDPEMSVAWMQLGEVYTHLLPAAGNPDSLARIAFDEAYRLDPSARNLLLHSIELRLREGDVQSAGPLVRAFLAGEPDSVLAQQITIMYDCARAGTLGVQWMEHAKRHPLAVLSSSKNFQGGGARLPCAVSGYEAILAVDTTADGAGRRWSAVVGLGSALLAQGKPAEAKAVVDTAIARKWGGAAFYLMAGPVYKEMQEPARSVARHDESQFGPAYSREPYVPRLWQLGVWEAMAGRPNVAATIATDLESRARRSGVVADARLARSMAAFATLARGDTAAAESLLAAIVAEPVPGEDIVWDLAAPRGMERLTLARLLAAKGDYRKAIEVANVFDVSWPSIYLLYVPASLELRMQAAAALSDERMTSRFRDRLAALRGERTVAGK